MPTKKYISLSRLQTFLDNLRDTFASVVHTHTISDISDLAVDTELSSTSANPVANSVLDAEFEAISTSFATLEASIDDKASASHTHEIADVNNLQDTVDEINDTLTQKSQVQIIESDVSEILSTLKIHKLTQEEYEQEIENGTIEENALYLTPDEEIDLSGYATIEQIDAKANVEHTHTISDVTDLQIALDEVKSYTDSVMADKADVTHIHAITDVDNLQSVLDAKVSILTTINGKALSTDITLSASDVGADVVGSASSALEEAKSYASDLADGKSDIGHTHDDAYYTEGEIDTKVSEINISIENIISGNTTVAKASHALTADSATSATSAEKAVQDGSGNIITSTYETKDDASTKLTEAKTYADSIKNDLLNGAGEAYDTLKELGNLIDDNTDAIDALEIVSSGKADKVHEHNDIYYTETEIDTLLAEKSQVQIITWEDDD